MDTSILEEAGIADADAFIASTDGDNTNIVIAQVAKRRYEVPAVAARILDPARADFYSGRGFNVVSPTSTAIAELSASVLSAGGS
jgi:trk system potassium uptake protein TrkA